MGRMFPLPKPRHGGGRRRISATDLLAWSLAFALATAATGRAAAVESGNDDPLKGADLSLCSRIFAEGFPGLHCPDAPTLLNALGERIWYAYGLLDDHRSMNTREDEVRPLPTLEEAAGLLELSGLDMREILRYEELLAAGDRRGLIALLTRYLEPDTDKYNLRALEGYDPAVAVNATRDHVFRVAIGNNDLEKIRGKVGMFHDGRYAEYRAAMEKYLLDYPNLSYLHVEIGNACFAEGDLDAAEQWYRRGATANPANPMLGYSMAMCQLARGNAPAAIEALTGAISTCRTNLLSWLALDCLLPTQGGRLDDNRFHARAVWRNGLVVIDKGFAEKALMPWLCYGAAENVIWNDRTRWDRGINTWDLEAVEYYKIAHLLGVYITRKQADPAVFDPQVERIKTIYDAGLLREFVLFEAITPYRQGPRLAALNEERRARMRDYLDRFVVSRGDRGLPGSTGR